MTDRVVYVLDTRSAWGAMLCEVAGRRDWMAKQIRFAPDIEDDGYGFVRIHSHPVYRVRDQLTASQMRAYLSPGRMIQDERQIELYDDKRGQAKAWAKWMPETWIYEDLDAALEFLRTSAPFPLISKADVGASSANVRYLATREEAEQHVRQAFGGGIEVSHCSYPDKATSLQRGYVYLQRFIPHEITYRVNIIGRQYAVFYRNNYQDRPVAETGNVAPAMRMTPRVEDLLAWADGVFAELKTKWCALDVLRDGDSWRLLETSLCWPWPSPHDCMRAPFFGGSTRTWAEMWDVLLDELEAGVWHMARSKLRRIA